MGGKQYAQPQPSTPKLFETTWRSEAPASNSAAMSGLGIPHRPNRGVTEIRAKGATG